MRLIYYFRLWLFRKGTRVLNMLNIIGLVGWLIALIVDSNAHVLPALVDGGHVSRVIQVLVIFLLFISLVYYSHKHDGNASVLAGFLTLCVALLWSLVVVRIWNHTHAATPDLIIWLGLCIFSWFSGEYQVEVGKRKKSRQNQA